MIKFFFFCFLLLFLLPNLNFFFQTLLCCFGVGGLLSELVDGNFQLLNFHFFFIVVTVFFVKSVNEFF